MSKTILDFLNLTPEQEIQLEQAALGSDPNELWNAIRDALLAFGFDSYKNESQGAKIRYGFLQKLSEISPTCKKRLPGLFSPRNIEEIDQLLQDLVDPNLLQDVKVDFFNAMKIALQHKQKQQAAYVQRLKSRENTGIHVQHTDDERNAMVDRAIRSKSDNAMFDIRAIGHLLAMLIDLEFIAPLDDKNFPKGVAYVEPKEKDEYRELASKMHGGENSGFPQPPTPAVR